MCGCFRIGSLGYCDATRPGSDRAGVGAQPAEHRRGCSGDEQFWISPPARGEPVRTGVSRSAIRGGGFVCPGGGGTIQDRGRSRGGLYLGGGNDGRASSAIASPAAAAGRRRSTDPQADGSELRGAAVWLGEIWLVERGSEPLPRADAGPHARSKYFDESGAGCRGLLVRNRAGRQGRASGGETAGRAGG